MFTLLFRAVAMPAALLAFCAASFAQYPGNYPPEPHPPTPPGGQYPGSETQLPSHQSKKKAKKRDEQQMPHITAEGRTIANNGKQLIIHIDDGRTWTMAINSDTKWMRAGAPVDAAKVAPRTIIRAEAAEDNDYDLIATNIELLKDAPPQAPPVTPEAKDEAAQGGAPGDVDDAELTRPSILHPPDAPGRPIIKHGKPASQPQDDSGDDAGPTPKKVSTAAKARRTAEPKDIDFTINSPNTAAPKHSMGSELLDQTTDWLSGFNHGLPNYVCEQQTTRYIQENRSDDWHAQDVISARVINEDGRDRYENLMLDGKRTNKTLRELGGQTSTGEFGGMLASMFQPGRAEFTFQRSGTLEDTEVAIYTYKVPLAKSDWQIYMGGQMLMPAYSGRVWVDKKTARIMRFEQHADNIPKDFPLDTVETAVDYFDVPIETFHFWLPSHAENLSCQRGSSFCAKNVMDFRDYHKYQGEGTITFH